MPSSKYLSTLGLGKESTPNTAIAPTRYYMANDESFDNPQEMIVAKGLSGAAIMERKEQAGAFSPAGGFGVELDAQTIGEILMAGFGQDSVGTAAGVGTHTFTRLGTSALQTYTAWIDRRLDEFEYTSCMLSKLTISGKRGEAWQVKTEWVARGEGTSLGTQATSFGTLQPFTFAQTTFTLNGTANVDVDEFEVVFDNMVKAGHVLGTSRYPGKIWTEGMQVTGKISGYYENLTERNLFYNGNRTPLNVAIVHSVNVTGSIPYRLALDFPDLYYEAFPPPQADSPVGPYKFSASFRAVHAIGSSYGVQAQLVNTQTATY